MHFALMHLDDTAAPAEEALIAVPGAGKTVIAVPLDALPGFLPILDEAVADQPPACCPACSAELPARGPE
ncbi:MAG: hypothetical protein QOG15_2045 [Solirubrobacteraceae bacterium]|jgi:hypothetical protein|nr:hypothetical protein [Solirubrobacteraceae bacterium]